MPAKKGTAKAAANADSEELDRGEELSGDSSTITLEEKYKEQMRQITPQKIELPISTILSMVDNQIDLNPDFQRRGRWDVPRQSRFIESIIMNVPIPPVFLGEDEYGSYVVLDGRQRLTAVTEFLKNSFRLKNLHVWGELNGKSFNDLKKEKLDRFLTRRFIPAIIILKESSPEVKYDVFERLNTGGIIAEPMEIRNAIFQGKFNEHLRKLSDNHTFRKLWGIPINDAQREANKIYQQMDDMELVLRFFALRDPEAMGFRFKDYLSFYMSERNALYVESPELAAEDEEQFLTAVSNCWRVFGEDAFRKPSTNNRSAPLADSYMVALSETAPKALEPKKVAHRVGEALHNLVLEDAEFQKAIGTGTNGKGAIATRIGKARAAVQDALEA